jgi:hypothetical protein
MKDNIDAAWAGCKGDATGRANAQASKWVQRWLWDALREALAMQWNGMVLREIC